MYKPLAGFCVATAVFICALSGAPVPPDSAPPATSWAGAVIVNGSATSITLRAGQTIILEGSGFAAHANVTFTIYSAPMVLAEVVADGAGLASATAVVPSDTPTGQHTIVALGNDPADGPRVLGTVVAVSGGTVAVPVVGNLPYTGIRVGAMLASGIVLLISGFALIRLAALRGRNQRGSAVSPASG